MLLIGRGPSAKALREALGLPRVKVEGGQVYARVPERTFRDGRVRYRWQAQALHDRQRVVCWGQTLPFPRPEQCKGYTLNERIISDKIVQLSRFWQEDIPHPVVALSDAGRIFTVPGGRRDGTWLARKRFHFGGHDIIGPMEFDDLAQRLRDGTSDYGVQLIDKRHEWRIHIFLGEVLRIAHKIPYENAGVVWNQENSHFRYDIGLKDETHLQLATLAKNAVTSLGMDFGAADVIRDREGAYYVLEVNSAPGIADNGNTLAAYVRAIQEWAGDRGN